MQTNKDVTRDDRETASLLDSSGACPYGFKRSESFDYTTYNRFIRDYIPVMMRRKRKWEVLLTKSRGVPEAGSKIKRFIRKGVPLEFRAQVWLSVSGAEGEINNKPNYYAEMLRAENDPDVLQRIELDVLRTFPENVHFQEEAEDTQVTPLRNVLAAYANHNPTVGYCQGMNFVTGILLLVTKNEEQSFWLLDSLIGHRVPSSYYSTGMEGLQTDHFVLHSLLLKRTPRLVGHLQQHQIDLQVVTSRWFICLFVDVLPIETLLRVWDCLFLEGEKILFRVAVTLAVNHQHDILSQPSFINTINAFKNIAKGYDVLNCHHFINEIFTIPGSFPQRRITEARAAYQSKRSPKSQ
ncbi:growth hormone-regulated TBC protein 1-like [Corticium candelabrum]|uniref:growth hormone-regulated TBC protein 1-like n=1 Tax=Corticium candelabrum TaxID=121492 RepID=UPI002E260723|nr:growth hormone-regulated TBC protein 1-like [Corticium candelabrum]